MIKLEIYIMYYSGFLNFAATYTEADGFCENFVDTSSGVEDLGNIPLPIPQNKRIKKKNSKFLDWEDEETVDNGKKMLIEIDISFDLLI